MVGWSLGNRTIRPRSRLSESPVNDVLPLRMHSINMRETIRQEGLVDQAKLGSLRVAIHDQHGENEELASEIALIANQLGAPEPTRYVKEDVDWDFLALLGGSEVPEIPPGRSEDFCRVMLLDDGVRITTKQGGLPGNPSSLQKRGLCTAVRYFGRRRSGGRT